MELLLKGFTATGSGKAGIKVTSSKNILSKNNASYNFNGIYLDDSSNNMLNGNNASNNYDGISLYDSSNNTLKGNNASYNKEDGGISLYYSNNNTLTGNNASYNYDGISLYDSSKNNTLIGNNASYNDVDGISLYYSSNNRIYNNMFNNTENFDSYESNINTWNATNQSGTNIIGGPILGGNFWANPEGTGFSQTCRDVNGDGICDKSYTLNARNIDYLPLSMNFTKIRML